MWGLDAIADNQERVVRKLEVDAERTLEERGGSVACPDGNVLAAKHLTVIEPIIHAMCGHPI